MRVRLPRSERLVRGDPDLTDDELQVAINRVQAKRDELAAAQSSGHMDRVFSAVPNAAELYRKAIAEGLEGKPERMAKARLVLRELLGNILLQPAEDGSRCGRTTRCGPGLLLRAAGTSGRGEGICDVPAVPIRVRLR